MIFPILFTLNCSWRGVEDVAPYRVWLKPHSTALRFANVLKSKLKKFITFLAWL